MSDEWGKWIEHDGSERPLPVGTYVQVELDADTTTSAAEKRGWRFINSRTLEAILVGSYNWSWSKYRTRVTRYRIRKPKGLTILQSILREVEHTRTPEYTAG